MIKYCIFFYEDCAVSYRISLTCLSLKHNEVNKYLSKTGDALRLRRNKPGYFLEYIWISSRNAEPRARRYYFDLRPQGRWRIDHSASRPLPTPNFFSQQDRWKCDARLVDRRGIYKRNDANVFINIYGKNRALDNASRHNKGLYWMLLNSRSIIFTAFLVY